MSGFSIGAPGAESTPQQPAATAFSFGALKPTTSQAPNLGGFGAAAATQAFGATSTPGFGAAPATPAFGAPSTTSFGAAAANPAFGATPTPGFGAAAAAPAFGATPTPAFGAAASTPAFGAPATTPAFGATPLPAFGAAGAAQAFGAATAAPAFGATSTPGFGAAAPAPAFGTPTQAPAPTFGSIPATAAPAFSATSSSFGAPPAPASAGTTGFAFGAASQTTNTSTAAPSLTFGAATVTSQAPTGTVPTLGGLGGGTNFSFGKPAVTSSASLNFTTNTTATLGGGLFGKPATTTTTAAAPAPTPFAGLGGIDVSSHKPKTGDSQQDIKVKETQVPMEIARTADALKDYIKTQKTLSSDIGRTSTSKLTNVASEMMNLQWSLQKIANSVEDNYNRIKLLRKETSRTIQSVEMAQRTQDTPVGLQFENNAPFQFFQNLVAKYEQDLINFRQQIGLTERHMHSLTNPQNVTPEDLKRGFQQINESFISLAGRLHEFHQNVETQKGQYLNLRKNRLRDNTNVFEKLINDEESVDTSRITAGPTPFSDIMAISNYGKSFGKTGTAATQTGVSQMVK